MPRSSRLPLLLAAGSVLTLTAGLVPASAAPTAPTGPPAVTGGSVQAWKATPYVKPAEAAAASGPALFLAGDGALQAAAPAGSTRVRTAVVPTGDDPRTAAHWVGPHTGSVRGTARVVLHAASSGVEALSGDDNVAVRLWADAGTPEQELLGSATASAGTQPSAVTVELPVSGTVVRSLLLSVAPLHEDGEAVKVSYGSTAAPSALRLPARDEGVSAAAEDDGPTTVAVPDDDPLTLAATYIGRKAAEPTLGVTKAGNVFITAGDFDGISPATPQTLIYASYDGNKSFKDVTPRVAGQPYPPTTLDPYIWVDEETSRVYSDDLLVGCSLLQWSDDEGKTWDPGSPIACDSPVDDHQTIVTGNPPPGGLPTIGYPNYVYYCVNKIADAQCARSLDGGRTFSQTGAPAFLGVSAGTDDGDGTSTEGGVCGGLHGHIITDPAGRLYLPKGHCGNPWLAVSEDGGMTWRQTLISTMSTAGTHTAVASDTAGNIYYTWWEAGTLLPYMAVSKDSGKTFGPPLLVGPPGLKGANFPSIDAGEPGVVALSYPGTMNGDATDTGRPWNYYVNISYDALVPQPVFHSATANPVNDPVHRGVCLGRCAGMFDFLDLIFAPSGEVYAAAVDTCTGKCVTLPPDTRPSGDSRPLDAQGISVRQLRTGSTAPVAAPPAAAPPEAAPPAAALPGGVGTLPTTGPASSLPFAAAALLLLAAVALHRRGRTA